ncbi:hypothetical protein [Dokdonia sp.]|uniref:hypothetical protein n=1 Tax=Dokdonia sp. TaxID=2024995 RepID=UPI0032658A1E
MNFNKAIGITLLIITFFFSCSNDDDSSGNESIIYQEGNITITLKKIDDGRCPSNINCVWGGNAEVKMTIANEDESMDFTLNTAGYINEGLNFPTSASIFDLHIELIALQPYPEETVPLPLEDYTVSIQVN